MTPTKVQSIRDKHGSETQKILSSDCEGSPSLLTARIIHRTTSHLEFAIPNWLEFEKLREEHVGCKIQLLNFYQVTCFTKLEIDLAWNMARVMFPMINELRKSDKEALLRNFILKSWQFGPILDFTQNAEQYPEMNEEEYDNMIVDFYGGSFVKGKEMSRKEILRVFKHSWESFDTRVINPIVALNLDKIELMAIVWLIFFDGAFTNISPNCQEMCGNARKVILRELRNFQVDRNFDEMRFVDTLETLEMIERGEKNFMEELIVLEMHNVRLHDDFKAILKENRI